jgi:hydrogenase nickel incorporation protein HypB
MCGTCGCSATAATAAGERRSVVVDVHDAILAANDHQAAHNREHFLAARTMAINLMGSPGSGKTALLEATAAALGGRRSIAAMSGDLATERDAERLRAAGIPAAGITTGSACHLDAEMVHEALHHELPDATELLFIENVGNLVCPAIFDLGQTLSVVALAVTEGEDKPLKYPVIFQHADLVVLTKTDLLPHLDGVDVATVRRNLEEVAPGTPLLPVSARTGAGIGAWVAWLETRRRAQPRAEPVGRSLARGAPQDRAPRRRRRQLGDAPPR